MLHSQCLQKTNWKKNRENDNNEMPLDQCQGRSRRQGQGYNNIGRQKQKVENTTFKGKIGLRDRPMVEVSVKEISCFSLKDSFTHKNYFIHLPELHFAMIAELLNGSSNLKVGRKLSLGHNHYGQ